MRALVYDGPKKVAIKTVEDPTIQRPTDVVVKLTSTNICGSDLHMYEGRTNLEPGMVIGHENLGEVVAVGDAVDRIKMGDRVCLPFNIGCGFCANCERGLSGFCLTMVPGQAGAAFGFAGMGPFWGGQAEYIRVPYADYNCLLLPEDGKEKEDDYVMLADIFPTGYHATELAGVLPGDSVAVFGSGPVGLMAAYSSIIKGASRVFVVDRHPDRLKLAESIGAIAIDDRKGDPTEQIMHATNGEGVDRGCECVGYQAHDPSGTEHSNMTMNALTATVKATGRIGVVGVFQPEDPGSKDELEKKGEIAFDWGTFWFKGLSLGTGQCNVKHYNRKLAELIHQDRAKPSFIVSHRLPLESAPDAYVHFDNRENGWTKVILKPEMAAAS